MASITLAQAAAWCGGTVDPKYADISFLGAKLMELADMPTSAYQNFLLEMEEVLSEEDLAEEKQEHRHIHF